MKDYSGNARPFILVLCPESIRDRAEPLLDELERRGLSLSLLTEKGSAGTRPKRACGTIAFLSEDFRGSSLENALIDADAAGNQIVPVVMDYSMQSELIKRIVYAKNAVDFSRFSSTKDIADRLMTAECLAKPVLTKAQKSASGRLRATVIVLALAVLAAAGAFIYSKYYDSRQDAAIETPEPTEIPEEEVELIPGYTQAQLDEFRTVFIIGDRFIPSALSQDRDGLADIAYDTSEDDYTRWYYVADEEPVKVETAHYDDLDMLTYMHGLSHIYLIKVGTAALPDLSGLKDLCDFFISDCDIRDMSGLSGTGIKRYEQHRCQIYDYSFLKGCAAVEDVCLDLYHTGRADLSGFGPESLEKLFIGNNDRYTLDLSGLAACRNLKELEMVYVRPKNMDFLGGLESLESAYFQEDNNVTDISAIAACTKLETLTLQDMRSLGNLECLSELPMLKEVTAHCEIRDLNWLKGALADGRRLSLGFSRTMNDYSGLAAVKNYGDLHVNLSGHSYSRVRDYLTDAQVDTLQLYDIPTFGYEDLPKVNGGYFFGHTHQEDLTGLNNPTARSITLFSDYFLTSLKGLSGMPNATDIQIISTPVEDYEDMYQMSWISIDLTDVRTLPDFSRIKLRDDYRLILKSIEGIDNLDFLNDLPDEQAAKRADSIDLTGLDAVSDLSPLQRFSGNMLIVGPQLIEQARELVSAGKFQDCRIEYPDFNWLSDDEIDILSLDEIDRLLPSYLGRVRRLALEGDAVIPAGTPCEMDEDGLYWITDDGEKTYVEIGTQENLGRITCLTGLRELSLGFEPLTSLDGIQSFEELESISVSNCRDLTDISALFSLPSLRQVDLTDCGFDSVQGIQNLYGLETLSLRCNEKIKDLTPLLELEDLREVRVSADMTDAIDSLRTEEGEELPFNLIIEE